MRLVLIEDDFLQADWILGEMRAAFAGIDAARIATASAFIMQLPALEARPPGVFVVDEMLRWADPPTIEEIDAGMHELAPPADWRASRAGLELIGRIRASSALRGVPTILYTVLEKQDLREFNLPEDVHYVTKNTDPAALIEAVRTAVQRRR